MMPFQPGIGMLAVRLKLPVVPLHIEGLFQVLSREDTWPKSGTCSVKIGRVINCGERTSFEEAAKQVENAVRRLAELDSSADEPQ